MPRVATATRTILILLNVKGAFFSPSPAAATSPSDAARRRRTSHPAFHMHVLIALRSQPAIAELHKMQANLRLDESGAPAAPAAPPVPTATRPVMEVKKEDAGVRARAEYEYEVS